MRHQHPGGNHRVRVFRRPDSHPHIRGNVLVDVQPSLLLELHDQDARDGLGHRRNPVFGVRIDQLGLLRVHIAAVKGKHDLLVPKRHQGQPPYAAGFHRRLQLLLYRGRRTHGFHARRRGNRLCFCCRCRGGGRIEGQETACHGGSGRRFCRRFHRCVSRRRGGSRSRHGFPALRPAAAGRPGQQSRRQQSRQSPFPRFQSLAAPFVELCRKSICRYCSIAPPAFASRIGYFLCFPGMLQ